MINFRAFPSSQALPADVDETLTEAYYSGQPVALYTVRGARPSEDMGSRLKLIKVIHQLDGQLWSQRYEIWELADMFAPQSLHRAKAV